VPAHTEATRRGRGDGADEPLVGGDRAPVRRAGDDQRVERIRDVGERQVGTDAHRARVHVAAVGRGDEQLVVGTALACGLEDLDRPRHIQQLHAVVGEHDHRPHGPSVRGRNRRVTCPCGQTGLGPRTPRGRAG
jgi:hypothetical protein